MKLIQISPKFKLPFLTKLSSNNLYRKSFLSFCLLATLAALIWFGGPYISWDGYIPLESVEKRTYVVLILFLIWVLKFLLIDLDTPNPFYYKDPMLRKKLQEIQNRLQGALAFLKKTTVARQGSTIKLSELPLFLFIGPTNSGKTSLLANSGVNFILQKQSAPSQHNQNNANENCDWWLTRENNILDIPGHYLTKFNVQKDKKQKTLRQAVLWQFLLRLIRKYHGKQSIQGIILALPLPELMKQNDTNKLQQLLRDIFQRLQELTNLFPQPIPCQIVITKCDLLPGFSEFFAELNQDELNQAWGFSLSSLSNQQALSEVFTHQFNALIKKLNDQLIWRLHHERNSAARPLIKDFPLQLEQLKEFIIDFLKKYAAHISELPIQGIYLTSATQTPTHFNQVLSRGTQLQVQTQSLQILKEPNRPSRAYFIKQLLTHGLSTFRQHQTSPTALMQTWKYRAVYAVSTCIVVLSAILLWRDFDRGMKNAYALQNNLSNYVLITQQVQDPEGLLVRTLNMLNTVQKAAEKRDATLDISHFFTFYSDKFQKKSNLVYHQALQTILLPEIRNYLGEFLKNPINKNASNIYAAFTAYLMLGDDKHFQADYIAQTVQRLLPKSLGAERSKQLMAHLNTALTTAWQPLQLDANLMNDTRKYLIAMPSFQLAYIILQNDNDNNTENNLSFDDSTKTLTVNHSFQQISHMFTGKAFPDIMMQETNSAAQQAIVGNWILGVNGDDKKADIITALTDQLRQNYVTNYVDVWENLLTKVTLTVPTDLAITDQMIINLISTDSPMLQFLRTVHDNTYFEPITTASPKLQNLGFLVDKTPQAQAMLYQIFSSLQALHETIQSVLTADNEKKAAFNFVSARMQHTTSSDALTQLMIVANKSPEPIKSWLFKVANSAWRYLMQDSSRYLDTSWQNQVIKIYQNQIANRYPFAANANQEVDINDFSNFFGNPGVVINFFNTYLSALVDTSAPTWHWKSIDNTKLPFSDNTLRQIQSAMAIHNIYFPNGDNKLFVQFALQPYQFGQDIKMVKLKIDNKQIVDNSKSIKNTHMLVWPNGKNVKMTFLQLMVANQTINRSYPGEWGLFKLINQAFDSSVSKKEFIVNLSQNNSPAKYLLFTNQKINPFMTANLQHFALPDNLD